MAPPGQLHYIYTRQGDYDIKGDASIQRLPPPNAAGTPAARHSVATPATVPQPPSTSVRTISASHQLATSLVIRPARSVRLVEVKTALHSCNR